MDVLDWKLEFKAYTRMLQEIQIEATLLRLLQRHSNWQNSKDCGYKVVSHMMPDLPNVGMERDLE